MGKHDKEMSHTLKAVRKLNGAPNLVALARGDEKPHFWRNRDQALQTNSYEKSLIDEFPNRDSLKEAIDRRDFLKYTGAAALMVGLAGCRNMPVEKIVPYVKPPEEFVPGKPQYYATTFVHAGFGIGVLAESHMGRPTKLEGNPDHPASLGSSDAITQAAIYGLYDPDRLQEVTKAKDIGTWDTFYQEARTKIAANPTGFRVLAETTTSPSLMAVSGELMKKFPGAKWHHYEPVGGENAHEGTKLAFGEAVQPVYKFDQANVIVTLDADPFSAVVPGNVRYARDWSEKRKVGDGMNRIYSIESYPTLIGAMADHRLVVRPSEVEAVARAIQTGGAYAAAPWFRKLLEDLNANKGTSLVIAGDHQPPQVHALAHAINFALGNVGKTVYYIDPMIAGDEMHSESLKLLIDDMHAGKVSTLLILGGNPVYNAPADLGFGDALAKVPLKAHWSLHFDETSEACEWSLPANHFLESWGDARAYDGTVSLVQPLINPLYQGKTSHEVLDGLMGGARRTRDIVREHWLLQAPQLEDSLRSDRSPQADLAAAKERSKSWESWLEKGLVPNSALPAKTVSLKGSIPPPPVAAPSGTELVFLPDPHIYDGRYANVPWLQELQKPFSSLTWDNTVQMSPATARKQGVDSYDVVELTLNGKTVKGPVWVTPGISEDTVVIHLGYGRTKGGAIAEGPGFNAYSIRPFNMTSYMMGLEMKKVDSNFHLAAVHGHHQTEGRDIVRVGTLAELKSNPNLKPADEKESGESNLYAPEEFEYDGYKWAMTIDLNHCIGCNACVAACQSENNIPNVGKEQVIRERELHWIRIDRYYQGDLDNPSDIVFQPVPCMHCEQAPCEPVCPVAATTHSKEGLNQMIYNRCVGTRYCSNNCPYKVRRFNYINYGDRHDYPSTKDVKRPVSTLRLLQNPDVTVRGRGVMEKCTYCVQRINEARIEAKKRGTPIKDGEILTACQQACPTKTITFGNMADPNSAVSQKRKDTRNWQLLEELNTKPRTTYLGKVKNPNA